MSAKLFSELKLVTDNLLSIYAAANWEATERKQLNILIKGHTTYPQYTRLSDEDSFILLSMKVAIIYSLQKKTPKLSTWPTSVYSKLSNKTDLQPGAHIDKGIRAGPRELTYRNWLPYQKRKKVWKYELFYILIRVFSGCTSPYPNIL